MAVSSRQRHRARRAGFALYVDWGRRAERRFWKRRSNPVYFAPGSTNFSVSHYYLFSTPTGAATEADPISVAVTASDGRPVQDENTGVGVTVEDDRGGWDSNRTPSPSGGLTEVLQSNPYQMLMLDAW